MTAPIDTEPRAFTRDEVQAKFLEYLDMMINYWLNESRKPSAREKMQGMVFSMLVLLDGEAALPGFIVTPNPHPDDETFLRNQGENWYPAGVDIAGDLHDRFYNRNGEVVA